MNQFSLRDKKVVMIIAPKDFRDEEYFEPKRILTDLGAEVLTASTDYIEARGVLGGKVSVDLTIIELEVATCDAIVFVGGPGAKIFFNDPIALKIASEASDLGKVLGAICFGPMILANAGVLNHKRATAFESLNGKFQELGIDYVSEGLVQDGKIVTAQSPKQATEFGETIAEMLLSPKD